MVPLEQAGARRPPAVRRRINPIPQPLPASLPKPPLFKRRRFLIASSVVALAMGALIFMGVRGAAMYHLEVGELLAPGSAATARRCAWAARWSRVRQSPSASDPSASRMERSHCRWSTRGGAGRLQPDADVVMDGALPSGTFEASSLLAKCPSKYVPAP
jgi:hypothetical protein